MKVGEECEPGLGNVDAGECGVGLPPEELWVSLSTEYHCCWKVEVGVEKTRLPRFPDAWIINAPWFGSFWTCGND